jgi:hypothetical protein
MFGVGTASSGATFTAAQTTTGTFTTRPACSGGTTYPAAVVALDPTLYYRFGESAGATTVADASGHGHDGVVRQSSPNTGVAPPVTLGAAGSGLIWCDTTAGLSTATTPAALDSGSFVTWPVAQPNTNTFTVMAWVRTTSTTGGRVVGMSSSSWARDVHYDRQLVVDDTGRVQLDMYPGDFYRLTSTSTVNDGQPHFLVATLGPAGAALYVDGALEAADPAQTTAETYTGNEQALPPPPPGGSGGATPDGYGYWRVGWDNLSGWGVTDYGFAGVIDEAAVWQSRQLTAAEVAALWATNHW